MAKRNTHHDGKSDGDRRMNGQSRRRRVAVNPEWLRDFLSEMLTVEIGGAKLYKKALNELTHTEFEEELNEFLRETEHHVELCTEMLKAAGGDEGYRSPNAEAADHKAEGLISTTVPAELRDLNNIENLVLAETKDHWNWEMLESVEKKIGDAELRSMVTRAVREVRKQEQRHLDWNERTLTTLAMEAATKHEAMETEGTEREAIELE